MALIELKNFNTSSYFIAFNKVTNFYLVSSASFHPFSIPPSAEVSGALRRWPGDGEVDRYLAVQVDEGGQSATGEVPGIR